MLARYWHSADVRSILLDNSCKWPSCQMSETGYWIEGGKRLRLRPSNITFLPQKLLPPSKRARERTFCSADATADCRAKAHFLAPPPSLSRFHLSMRAATTNAAVVLGNFRHMPRRKSSALERGKKERGKTRNIIIPLGTMPKRGKEGEVQARTNSLRMQVACATRQEMPFPLLSLFPPHRTIIAAARTLYSAACARLWFGLPHPLKTRLPL